MVICPVGLLTSDVGEALVPEWPYRMVLESDSKTGTAIPLSCSAT
jgi:hypothetical protein